MSDLAMRWVRPDWRDPDLRRKAAVLAGAVALHVGVLAWLGLSVDRRLTCDDCDARPVFVEMEPRPLLPGETTRVRPPSTIPTLLSASRRTAAPTNVAPDQPQARPLDAPSPPTPHIAASPPVGAPAAPASTSPWSVAPESTADAVARSLRTSAVGCRSMQGQLTQAEQALCDDRFGAAAARAGPIGSRTLTPSEQRRESQFAADGAAALARYERRVAPLDGRIGVTGMSPDCPGGNLRGTCAGANLDSRYQHSEDQPFGARSGPK